LSSYRAHLEELAAHPREAEKAHPVLERIATERAFPKKYCDLLQDVHPPEDPSEKNDARVALSV
jgi:hypothetical protein